MNLLLTLLHALAVVLLPFLLIGLINRTKSWWVGRKGPGLLQSLHDLRRLLSKRPVVSTTAGTVFSAGAYVSLLGVLLAASMVPMLGQFAPMQFPHDFVVVAYSLSLARVALMLSAMDVGSAFEGMGAAREASYSSLAEPMLFLLIGTAGAATGMSSFTDLIGHLHAVADYPVLVVPMVLVLLLLLQVEAARVPVDDPSTHLELTMIHEVMILDHSGPELAAMQYAAAIKMTLYAGLIAALLNPLDPFSDTAASLLITVLAMGLVAIVIGCIESLMARLPLFRVPQYLLLGLALAFGCLLVVGVGGRAQ